MEEYAHNWTIILHYSITIAFTLVLQDNLSTALGLYSVSGSHGYHGYSSLNLKAGDTLVVSTAAGNIGIIGKWGGQLIYHLSYKIISGVSNTSAPCVLAMLL